MPLHGLELLEDLLHALRDADLAGLRQLAALHAGSDPVHGVRAEPEALVGTELLGGADGAMVPLHEVARVGWELRPLRMYTLTTRCTRRRFDELVLGLLAEERTEVRAEEERPAAEAHSVGGGARVGGYTGLEVLRDYVCREV